MGSRRRPKASLIAGKLLEGVKCGKYDVCGKLPSERMLASHYCVSRETVCSAIDMLERIGCVCKRPGAGTFLSKDKTLA